MKRYFLIVAIIILGVLPSVGLAQSIPGVKKTSIIAPVLDKRGTSLRLSPRDETLFNIGHDSLVGEDLEIRKAAIDALGSHAGTVVVMDPNTGQIITMVNQGWAISQGFAPCSTIKLVSGVAGLDEKVIQDDGKIVGVSKPWTLDDALAYSNNAYFQQVGSKVGLSNFILTAQNMGLGSITGINAEGEVPGKLPFGSGDYREYSHAYNVRVTPLQLAVLASEIGNGGYKVTPFIPKPNFSAPARREIQIPKVNLQRMLPGMKAVAQFGTASRSLDKSLYVAGKTGTCQNTGSFTSFAPAEKPSYAVVVITRGPGLARKGRTAAKVAGKVYQALAKRDPKIAQRPMEKPRPKLVVDFASDEYPFSP